MVVNRFKELTSCVRGELIELKFTGAEKMYVALLTEEEYNKYRENINSVKRQLYTSPAYFRASGEERMYIVHDLDGKDVSNIKGTVRRFAPDFTPKDAQGLPHIGETYVKNAHDTEANESMIQHWKDNQDKNSKLDLTQKQFVCPSCGKTVDTDTLNGAHVYRINDANKTLYITPTCESCNKSRVDRIFKVNRIDLILPPKE